MVEVRAARCGIGTTAGAAQSLEEKDEVEMIDRPVAVEIRRGAWRAEIKRGDHSFRTGRDGVMVAAPGSGRVESTQLSSRNACHLDARNPPGHQSSAHGTGDRIPCTSSDEACPFQRFRDIELAGVIVAPAHDVAIHRDRQGV